MSIKLLINILFLNFVMLQAAEVKVRVEKQQMANYVPLCQTRFDYVLDKTNVNLPKSVQDIILQYYQGSNRNYLIKKAHHACGRCLLELDPNTLASASFLGSKIKIWNKIDNEWLEGKPIELAGVKEYHALIKLSDGSLATSDFNGMVHIWKLINDNWVCIQSFAGGPRIIQLRNGMLVSAGRFIKLFQKDINGQFQRIAIWSNDKIAFAVSQLSDGRIAASFDREIVVLGISIIGNLECNLKIQLPYYYERQMISLNDNHVAVFLDDQIIKIFKINKDKYLEIQRLEINDFIDKISACSRHDALFNLKNNGFVTHTNSAGYLLNIFEQDRNGKWSITKKVPSMNMFGEVTNGVIELSNGGIAVGVDFDIHIIQEDVVLADPITSQEKKMFEDKHCVIQ